MSPALKEAPEQEEKSPLAGGAEGYQSDFLEEEKDENARAAGLREDKMSSMRGDEEQSQDPGAMGDDVAKDQSEMAIKRDFRFAQRASKKKQGVIDAKKLGKQMAKRVARALIQRGFNATVAAFLGSVVGILFGWLMAIYRVVAADVFQSESQQFDNIFEKLIYYLVVVLGCLVILIVVGAVVALFIAQYGWIISIYYWFN